ncbi:MAG: hypothetical protein ACRDQA_15195, partial [Nocardioidaceae bacterium]
MRSAAAAARAASRSRQPQQARGQDGQGEHCQQVHSASYLPGTGSRRASTPSAVKTAQDCTATPPGGVDGGFHQAVAEVDADMPGHT